MPVSVKWGWLGKIGNRLENFWEFLYRNRMEDAEEVSRRLLAELRSRQPIGKEDQFANAFPRWRQEKRPSVRQGLVPIEEGWRLNVRGSPTGPILEIGSESEHLKYFTLWTGRSWLGTHKGRPQVAKNAKTLAFWWRGEGHWQKSANGGGFTPSTDFIQDSYDAIKPELSNMNQKLLKKARWFLIG